MEYRDCKKCGIKKELSEKFFYMSKGYFSHTCRECKKQEAKTYRQDHEIEIKEHNIRYRKNNRQELIKYAEQYYKNNKEELKQQQKERYNQNKDNILAKKKEYYIDNRESILDYKSKYSKNNRPTINIQRQRKIKNDMVFMLRCLVSQKVRITLTKNNSTKNNNSVWKYLPYSPTELKEHLERQFEPWMTWNNYGSYKRSTWDNNNPITWAWNIDHIIPQSSLLYASMTDDNFKKCWELNNLRPLSAKQNIIDGNRRIVNG